MQLFGDICFLIFHSANHQATVTDFWFCFTEISGINQEAERWKSNRNFQMTSCKNQLEKRSATDPDKPINRREGIYVKNCMTEREYREEMVRHYLAVSTLPFYMLLLMMSLVASWWTGNEAYLKCFTSILRYVTPLVMIVYGYYFYKVRNQKRRVK